MNTTAVDSIVPRQTHTLNWHGEVIPVRIVESWETIGGDFRAEIERLDGKPFVSSWGVSIYHTVDARYLVEVADDRLTDDLAAEWDRRVAQGEIDADAMAAALEEGNDDGDYGNDGTAYYYGGVK